jgi:predicted amidohydrolase YtcJ
MKDILFRNGTVFDGHRFLPAGTWVRVRGGRLDADFAILDADLAAIEPHEICQASVRQTWLRGHPA